MCRSLCFILIQAKNMEAWEQLPLFSLQAVVEAKDKKESSCVIDNCKNSDKIRESSDAEV